nr:hypothetical protein [Herbidospora solisilvae]
MWLVQFDGFAAVEQDVRAMVADPRWSLRPMEARAEALARRGLSAHDGSCWIFGLGARWYRRDADGQWMLAPPPAEHGVRNTCVRVNPAIPWWLVPQGPDFAADRGSTQGFVGPDVLPEVAERIRAILAAHRGLSQEDFPLVPGPLKDLFAPEVTSPVAVVWGVVMWCAYAPAFDGNEQLLTMFGEFLGRPLPGDDWVRWLPGVRLEAVLEPYRERLAAGAHETALRLAGLAAEVATVLSDDPRFRPRAQALTVMIEPLLRQPWLDHGHADRGSDLARHWLHRLPPHLTSTTIHETAPKDHFQHTFYDLTEALGYLAGRGVDPRLAAGSLLACDLSTVADAQVTDVFPLLDDEVRRAVREALDDSAHPLRALWPVEGALPDVLAPPGREAASTLLGAAYATGLAWSAMIGRAVPERGFPSASAVSGKLIHERDDTVPSPLRMPGRPVSEITSEWLYHS